MRTDKFALVCALLVLSVLEPITARKGFSGRGGGSHSYPHSSGLSGSGSRHSYPSSGGLSGGGSHGYPSSGGHSGGSHAYPSSGGSHAYPPSGGSHAYPSSGGHAGGSHAYPASGGLSGSGTRPTNNHGYPAGGGLSGNTGGSRGTTNVHHHYHYSPPKEIRYTPAYGGAPMSYPVYHGSPPTYVYKYQNSGSKYGTLLAGLALLNLGALAAGTAAYAAASHNHGNSHYSNYKPQPGIISVCWVAGAGVGLLPLFGWHAAVPADSGCYFVEVMDYNYLLFLYLATIVTPSVLLAAFYAHIYRVVVKQMSEVMTVGGSQGRVTGGGTMLRVLGAAQKREVKATQNLAIIVFFFMLCWIPLYTINAIKAFMPHLDIPNPLTYFAIIFSHLNSAINPLLYAYHLKDFRAALKRLICTILGRGVAIPAAYRPPMPVRRPNLERCNALRERPKIYVHSPVWLRQKEAERLASEERDRAVAVTTPVAPDVEPFLMKAGADGSSGRLTPEDRECDRAPYLINTASERCQSPYRRVEELIRRVRSVSDEHS